MANIAYIRVSSAQQDFIRQEKMIADNFGKMDKVFQEKASGKDIKNRPIYKEMIAYLREGDTLHVASIDRLARSINDFFRFIDWLAENKIGLKIADTPLINIHPYEPQDPTQRLMTGVLTSVAQWEREIMLARQREALEARRAAALPIGKPRAVTWKQLEEMKKLHDLGVSKSKIAKRFKLSRATIRRYLAGEIEPYK